MRIGFCAYIPWCRFHASAHNGCGTRAARAATGATYGESYSDCCRTPRHRPGNPPLIVATSAIDVSPPPKLKYLPSHPRLFVTLGSQVSTYIGLQRPYVALPHFLTFHIYTGSSPATVKNGN